jgi:hypothetical protein
MTTTPTAVNEMKATTATHTPGPWRVDDRRSGHRYDGGPVRYFSIAHTSETRDCFVALDIAPVDLITSVGSIRNAEGEANARLIAAAPELLEALINLYEIGIASDCERDGDDSTRAAMKAALAAIAKTRA